MDKDRIVIFIPGIMGSRLRYTPTDEIVWPGKLTDMLGRFSRLDELMSDDIKADGIIENYGIVPQYSDLIVFLENSGFERDKNLFIFAYDWRKENELAAQGLSKLIEEIVGKTKSVKITIIAHSMGGLIARYYLESGKFSKKAGFENVDNLITLGTPHRGAPLALTGILGQDRKAFLAPDQVKKLAADERFTAVYQLLPPADEKFVWNDMPNLPAYDIFEEKNAKSLNLSPAGVRSNIEFYKSLKGASTNSARYFLFVGSRQKTAASLKFDNDIQQGIRKHEVEYSGDGTVPIQSGAGIPGAQTRAVSGEHSVIYKSNDLKRVLDILLGNQPHAAAEDFEISVREDVIEPAGTLHVVLACAWPQASIHGKFVIEEQNLETGELSEIDSQTIDYDGADVDVLSVSMTAPDLAACYKLSFVTDDDGIERSHTNFFVQEPAMVARA